MSTYIIGGASPTTPFSMILEIKKLDEYGQFLLYNRLMIDFSVLSLIWKIFLRFMNLGWSYWQFKKYQDLTTTTRPARVESFILKMDN